MLPKAPSTAVLYFGSPRQSGDFLLPEQEVAGSNPALISNEINGLVDLSKRPHAYFGL
jgi:hypothetical protein